MIVVVVEKERPFAFIVNEILDCEVRTTEPGAFIAFEETERLCCEMSAIAIYYLSCPGLHCVNTYLERLATRLIASWSNDSGLDRGLLFLKAPSTTKNCRQ